MMNPRTRMVAVASSMAISLSLVAGPVALAQDDATAPIREVLSAFSEGRFSDAAEPFCAELEAEALGGLGQASELGALGLPFDLSTLLEALDVNVDGLEVNLVEESGDDALVSIAGPIEVGFDEDALVTALASMMSTEEEPLDEEFVRGLIMLAMPDIEAMMSGPVELDETVDVIREDGVWRVCGDLSSLTDALTGAMSGPVADGASSDDMDDAADDE